MVDKQKSFVLRAAIVAGVAVVAILVAGTIWIGHSTAQKTEEAVHSVSMLYLDELAGRREQVVAANLASNVRNLLTAIDLMSDEDLSDVEHLQEYQTRMKQLYDLERFAFVGESGLIYTSNGVQTNIDDFAFDHTSLEQAEISVLDVDGEKKVVIAVPVEGKSLEGEDLVACFMQIDMDRMLEGVSMQADVSGTTFCNIYTRQGDALTDVVLGGLAKEDNLLEALRHATFEDGRSADEVADDFANGRAGAATFSYDNVLETLAYVPVKGTDWMLTYLIRESVISEKIGSISQGIVVRTVIQSVLTAAVLLGMFAVVITQTRKSNKLTLEKETADAENRARQLELQHQLQLQEQLLDQERQRKQLDAMITALASDYRSVYYVNLDENEGICYRSDSHLPEYLGEGDRFAYYQAFRDYAERFVADSYREGFLRFINPETIRQVLTKTSLVAFRYLTTRGGHETYEMLRIASVRHPEDREGDIVRVVGMGFTDIDDDIRDSMARNQALSDALAAAEDASKAKTAFLSNMSHEIRTPMNAIIGLTSIGLANDDLSAEAEDHLRKIDSSAHHLLSLINDILDMSRIESGRMTLKNEEFSLPKLLEQVNVIFGEQCQEKGLTYKPRVVGYVDDHYIGDNMKLRQVLINILGNAVKFTPEGGTVEFTVQRVVQFDDKSTLEFTIADTGIGMSEEFLPHIFETFAQEDSSSTNKYGSSGLGLSISKSIVEMMNGDIQVKSTKGEGTTFTVTVTLMDSERRVLGDEIEEIRPRDMSVLVVDDDPIACEHARLVLEKVGIAAETVQSGAEAVERVRLRHARREAYNLILVDWKMPNMDGVETAGRIREIIGDKSAIIILTAYRWDDVLEEALEAGVDSFVAKPLFAETVLEEFQEALRRRHFELATMQNTVELAGTHVLIAEDNDINAEILEMILQMREITCERANNGREAVELFSSHEAGHYDAVLMDIRMPEMDGLEATAAIRALEREDAGVIPIVALTANAFDEDVQRSLQAGMNAHLTKPIEPDALFQTLESLVGGGSLGNRVSR